MTPFEKMRADLVRRGLIDAEHRITPAGLAWTEDLLRDLAEPAPPLDTGRSGVR